jgi:septal ring-binding cell division protein DamX
MAGSAATAAATTAAAAPSDLPEFSREPRLADFADTPPPEQAPVVFQSPSRQMPWGWLFLVLLLSLAAFAYMYRDLVLTEVELMKKYLLRGTPAAATPASAADATASAQLSASASALVAASQPASAVASSASDALAPVAVPEPVVMASAAASAAVVSPAEKASAPASVPQSVTAPPKTDTKTDSKVGTDGSDAAWLKQLPNNSFVVQLAAFDTEEEVLAFKRSNKLYEKTRVLSPPKKGSKKRYFILVAGPFDTKVDADAYMRTSPLLAKAWLRSSQSIISQFERP